MPTRCDATLPANKDGHNLSSCAEWPTFCYSKDERRKDCSILVHRDHKRVPSGSGGTGEEEA
jgi:hypothetical protein